MIPIPLPRPQCLGGCIRVLLGTADQGDGAGKESPPRSGQPNGDSEGHAQGHRDCLALPDHLPPELLPTSAHVLRFIPHQVKDRTSHLLLKGPSSPTDAQPADSSGRRFNGAQTFFMHLTLDHKLTLTPAHCRNPWAGRGRKTPGLADGPPPSASWLLGWVLALAASGPQPL